MKKPISAVVLAVVFMGSSSLPVSGQTKFDKYEVPARIRAIDWLLLNANLRLMGSLVRDREKVGIPLWSYDGTSHKIKAAVTVSREVAKGVLSDLRTLLNMRSIEAFVEVKIWVPELKEQDAEIMFYYMDWDSDGGNIRGVEFAFY